MKDLVTFEIFDRSEPLVRLLTGIWERSVRATHSFLSSEEVENIKEHVPDAIKSVEHLVISLNDKEVPLAFIGVNGQRIEMLFVDASERDHGIGKALVDHAFHHYHADEVTVNEQNPQSVGFYEHMGFQVFHRSEMDEQGNPYPLLYMKRKAGNGSSNGNLAYSAERFTADLASKTYIEGYRRADYFLGLCKQCKNYGRRHGCPPFDYDPLSVLGQYAKVRIIGVKIIPIDKSLPLSAANDLMMPVTRTLNEELLGMERTLGGYSFGFVGVCPYCGGAPCTRIDGQPCRHPDKVRPSLEAFGFDMSKTAKDLLGLDIKWSHDGLLPEYLTLICGIFYNYRYIL